MKRRRLIGRLAAVLLTSVVVVVSVALFWRDEQRSEEARLCQRSVSVRADQRAMWEWLFDEVAGTSDPARLARAIEQLDLLLPRLTCDNANHPIPVADTSPPTTVGP